MWGPVSEYTREAPREDAHQQGLFIFAAQAPAECLLHSETLNANQVDLTGI